MARQGSVRRGGDPGWPPALPPAIPLAASWASLTGTPTTLAGYGITDAYTKAAVDALFAAYVPPVTSVFGRTGAVVAATNDYAFSQISGTIATGQVSGAYGGITGVGTLASGAVPASLVTAGTFGTGAYVFPSTLKVSTSLGVNTGASAAAIIVAGGTHPGSGSVSGINSNVTLNTGVTSMQAVVGRIITPGSTYTLNTAIGLYSPSPSIGSGDAITTIYGSRVDNQGGASVGTSYAFFANTQSTSVTNTWAFYSAGTAQSHFGGPLSLVGTQPSTNFDSILSVGYNGAAHPSTSTSAYGVQVDYSIPTTATVGSYPFWGRNRWTAGGVYNAMAVFRANPPVTAAGATAVSSIGFWAQNQGLSGVTSSYGLLIDDQSGSTNNYAIKTGAGLVQFGDQVKSTVPTGTTPFIIASTDLVSNLTSQYLGASGQDAAYFLDPTHLSGYGAAASYLRSTGSAWAVVSGVAAGDVTAGTFGAGAYTFPSSLAVASATAATINMTSSGTAWYLLPSTVLGSDTNQLILGGGGADATNRGGTIVLGGNQNAINPGMVGLYAGSTGLVTISGSTIQAVGILSCLSGDLKVSTVGKGLFIKEGTNAKMGTAVLAAGTKVVSTTAVTASSRIFITCQTPGGTPGWLRVSTRTAGTSFTILSSSATDTSTVAWVIVEPA